MEVEKLCRIDLDHYVMLLLKESFKNIYPDHFHPLSPLCLSLLKEFTIISSKKAFKKKVVILSVP